MRLVLLALLATAALAAPKGTVYVGQLFERLVSPTAQVYNGPEKSPLPDWLIVKNDILQGIPTEKDIGSYLITVDTPGQHTYQFTVNVIEESDNGCNGEDAYWLEASYDSDNSASNKIDAFHEIADIYDNNTISSIRVFNMKYARQTREVELIMEDTTIGNYVVIWRVACNDFDLATTVMDSFIDNDDVDYVNLVMTKGQYSKKIVPETTTFATTTRRIRTTTEGIRTTRRAQDNKPILLNGLPSYTCIRGEICTLRIPSETFKDAEEGNTFRLRLTIVPIEGAEQWMGIKEPSMTGVPLKEGEFSYRLEARDKAGNMASAAFTVLVKPSPPNNHKFRFELDTPSPIQMMSKPQLRSEFLNTLSKALKMPTSDLSLQEVASFNNKTIIVWNTNSLPITTCDEDSLTALASMMIMKQKQRTKTEFVKAMGNSFYVRKAALIRSGNCAEDAFNGASTPAPTFEVTQEATIPWWYWLIAICLLLVIVSICGILWATCSGKGGKKKEAGTDYVGKGVPVVFPDEVDDHHPTHAGTPMLAQEERPPLKISQHENPIYKPSTPLSSSSPRVAPSTHQRIPPPFIPP